MTTDGCSMFPFYEYACSPFAQDPDQKGFLESGHDLGFNSRSTSSENAASASNQDTAIDYFSTGMLAEQQLPFFPPPRTADLIRVNDLNGVAHIRLESSTPKSSSGNSGASDDIFTAGTFLKPRSDILSEVLPPVSQDELIPIFDFEDVEPSTDRSRSASAELSSSDSVKHNEKHGSHSVKNHKVFF